MKKKLLAAALLSVVAAGAMAQSAFEGAYGQLGIGYESMAPQITQTTLTGGGYNNLPLTSNIGTAGSIAGTATIGYTFAIDKNLMLGIGGEYSPLNSNSVNDSFSYNGTTLVTGTAKKQNAYNFFIAPGVMVGKDGMAYAKLGYTGISIKTGTGNTYNLTGYSMGLGYKQFISGSIYGFAETNYSSYSNTSANSTVSGYALGNTISANSYNFLLGVGYKF